MQTAQTVRDIQVTRGEYYFGLAMAWFIVLYPVSEGISLLYFK